MGLQRQWWQNQRHFRAPRHQGPPYNSPGTLKCLNRIVYQQHAVARTMATLVAESAAFCASAEAAGSMERMSLSRGKAIYTRSSAVTHISLTLGDAALKHSGAWHNSCAVSPE